MKKTIFYLLLFCGWGFLAGLAFDSFFAAILGGAVIGLFASIYEEH